MRIATLEFDGNFLAGDRSMHRYADVFRKLFCETNLSYADAKNYDGDAIVCFNGRPDLGNLPPREFKGMKIVHLMDHVFRVEETLKKLDECGISHLMVYSGVENHDPFFRHFFSRWQNATIGVPFGFNDLRFRRITPFNQREKKVIALGAINPVADPLCLDDIQVFSKFFSEEEYTHKWRNMLRCAMPHLTGVMDSRLPNLPKTKDFAYDIVSEYNNYQMFTTCESIMRYPSVKTFEGMACGSVLVCSDHPCYKDLGLIDGFNCIMHKDFSLSDFKEKVNYWIGRQDLLWRIARNGYNFAQRLYSPESVAGLIYDEILGKTVDKC